MLFSKSFRVVFNVRASCKDAINSWLSKAAFKNEAAVAITVSIWIDDFRRHGAVPF